VSGAPPGGVVIVDTDVVSFIFKGDTRGALYRPHLDGQITVIAAQTRAELERRVKYLNNVIEQDHRFIKKKVRASQCFKSFHTAERTLEGIEAMHMIRKGQVKRLAGSDARGQATFVASLFGVAA
jgi:hypothetical protein